MGSEFRKNVITLVPRASLPLKKFGELSFGEIKKLTTALTPEEEASLYADLYRQKNPLTEEQKRVIEGPPMDMRDAFEPERYGEHMNVPGLCRVENGYCVLPDGVTWSAARIIQPGRTNEKMDAYNKEFALEGALAYKLWCPGYHYYSYEDGCVEDFGYGLLNMKNISDGTGYSGCIDIGLFGIKMEEVTKRDPACVWISGNYWQLYPVLEDRIAKEPIDIIILNYLREIPEGRELRIRLFGGLAIRNGTLVRTKMPDLCSREEYARQHMKHLMLEYGNEARLVNQFWERRNHFFMI